MAAVAWLFHDMSLEEQILDEYPIDDRLDGWHFRVEETCSGYWEAFGINLNGQTVSRTVMGDPDLALEACVNDALEN